MFTTRRPRRVPNSTWPATSANRVSSPPRPTPSPGWKCVPRCRTMISPAPTIWPPKRLTPRRWALESRPLRVEDAPFLCAMRAACLVWWSGAGPSGLDRGDLDAGQLLAVALALPVPGLVLELHDRDLRALLGSDDLGRHPGAGQGGRVARDVAAVHEQNGGQLDGVAGLRLHSVHDDDVADGHLLLTAASADDRVHVKLTLLSFGVAVLGRATTHAAHGEGRHGVQGRHAPERTDPSGYGGVGSGVKPGRRPWPTERRSGRRPPDQDGEACTSAASPAGSPAVGAPSTSAPGGGRDGAEARRRRRRGCSGAGCSVVGWTAGSTVPGWTGPASTVTAPAGSG